MFEMSTIGASAGTFAERDVAVGMWKMASEQRTERIPGFLCEQVFTGERITLGCDRSACYSGRVLWDSLRFVSRGMDE